MSKINNAGLIIILFLIPVLASAQSIIPEFTRFLSLHMRGNDVKSLQEFLANDAEIYPEGLITGYFGFKTKAAVKKWQEKYGIEAAGIVGPKTIAKIKEISKSSVKKSAPPAQSQDNPTTQSESSVGPAIIPPPDTTSPIVTLYIGVPSPTSVNIKFTTNEEVTAIYEYGLTINYGLIKEVTTQYSSDVAEILLDSLISSTTYQVRAKVTDRAGNIGYSQNYTFTTPSVDDAPLLSYGPYVTPSDALPKESVKISWRTNIPCTGTLYFDSAATFGNSKSSGYRTDHAVIIEGLGSNAAYVSKIHCDIKSKALKTENFIFVATSTDSSSSMISSPFLANILKTFEVIFQKFKLDNR